MKITEYEERRDQLAEIQRLREALAVYANPNNLIWQWSEPWKFAADALEPKP